MGQIDGVFRFLPWVVCLVLAFALGACGDSLERPNVVLVTFDTTRADHIGCYGSERAKTPTIDALAAEGLRFTNAQSTIPLTLPSHTTILTGLFTTGHGIRDNGLFVLGDEITTLPEMLAPHGYASAAAIGGFPLVKRFNLNQGFDLYDDELRKKDDDIMGRRPRRPSLFFDERRAGQVNAAVLPWIKEHRNEPFFVWIHYYDPHRPWDPPAPYDQLLADDPYLAEIAYADESLGHFLDELKGLGVYEDTMVIFTSDHGEGLGEHNESTHSLLNYQTTQHVPMIIRPPGGMEPQVIDDLVAGVDITPTVLDYLGLPIPDSIQGYSLAPYVEGTGALPENRQFYSETLSPRLSHGWGEVRTLYQGDWKYIHGARPELFDLAADPDELNDLIAKESVRAEEMRQALARHIEANAMKSGSSTKPVDEETKAKLLALGYLSGTEDSGPIIEELRSDGTPPQDRVMDINLSSEVRSHLTAGRGQAARQVALELLERDPRNPFYRELLIQSDMLLGRVEEAVRLTEELIENPGARGASAPVLLSLSQRLLATSEPERALPFAEEAVEKDKSATAMYSLARVKAQLGDHQGSYDGLLAVLDLEPGHTQAKVDLAIFLAQSSERELAREVFEEALAENPFYTKGHYNYGTFLFEEGDLESALEHFDRARTLSESYLVAHLAAVVVQLKLGQTDQAQATYERMLEMAPASEETQRALQEIENS